MLVQARYRYEVRRAQDGRLVGEVTVDARPDPPDCGGPTAFPKDGPAVSDRDIDPTGDQLDEAFAELVGRRVS